MRQFSRRCGNNGRTELDNAAFPVLEGLEARIMLSTVVTTPASSGTSSTNQTSSVVQSLAETIGNTWINMPVASQSGSFQFSFNATPSQNDENVVMGLSDGSADAYTELAAIVRFNPTGQIDVRDGSSYEADNTVNYVAGTSYSFTMDVDAANQTYSVYVTPAGGSQVELASNYTFRTEQADTSLLNNFSGYALVGSANITGGETNANGGTTTTTSAANSFQTDGDWDNEPITSQDAPFQISFDATPSQDDENVVLGLSNGTAGAYTDLAAIVRFNPTGQIDGRDQGTYQADNVVNYSAGTTYSFTMDVDPATQTYSVYVTPAGGSTVELASNYSFRSEQASTSTLNNIGAYALVGSAAVSNIEITPLSSMPTGSTSSLLNAPTDLSAAAQSSSSIGLTWTDNSGGSEEGFNILRSSNGSGYSQIGTVGASVTSYTDTGLSADTAYTYAVQAFNGAGGTAVTSTTATATTASASSSPASGSSSSGSSGSSTSSGSSASSGSTSTSGSGTSSNGDTVAGPSNTGPQAGVVLTSLNLASSSAVAPAGCSINNDTLYVNTAGTVVQDLAITNGIIVVQAPNVTIDNCTVDAGCELGTANQSSFNAAISVNANNVTVENTSVTGTGGGGDAIVVNWGTNGAVFSNLNVYNTGTTVFFLNGSATIEGCWLHDIGWNTLNLVNGSNVGGAHTDDVFVANASSVTLEGNYFENTATTDNGINYQICQNIMLQPFGSGDVIGAISITNNIIQGGGYMIYYEGGTSLTVANNQFGSPYFSFIYPGYVQGQIAWTNNTYQPTGQELSAPVISGNSLTVEPAPA